MRLTSNRYNEIEKEVIKLFEQITINKFPINCFEICQQLGIVLMPYSKLSDKKKELLSIGSKDGFNILWETAKDNFLFIIYYNDNMPARRVRFTIMHEIAHIVLGHTEHSDLAESEANHFAKYALAPPPIIGKLHIDDYIELSEVFDVSREFALYSMQNYINWLKYGEPELLEHEITLITLFKPVLSF